MENELYWIHGLNCLLGIINDYVDVVRSLLFDTLLSLAELYL
jgi:hypothetical protein